MKILIPVLGFGRAGGYRVLSRFADELIALGHGVDILCPEGSESPYFPTQATILRAGIDGIVTPGEARKAVVENAFSIQRKLSKALKNIPDEAYDIVLANHSLTVNPIISGGWKFKTLYYVQAYEPEMFSIMGGIKNTILGFIARRSYERGLFTVVNAEVYLNYKNLSAKRVLYPGIDMDVFYPEVHRAPKRKIIIGTIGRAERFKGTKYVLQAFKMLRQQFDNVELHIAFADAADFEATEGLHTVQPHGDKALGAYYRSLDYYFCASYFQLGAFHYPVAEAMRCAVPVITTSYYPANEENAWLVRSKNAKDFVDQFNRAQVNPVLKSKKVEQALADVQQFNWKVSVQKLVEYMQELTAAKQAVKQDALTSS